MATSTQQPQFHQETFSEDLAVSDLAAAADMEDTEHKDDVKNDHTNRKAR